MVFTLFISQISLLQTK